MSNKSALMSVWLNRDLILALTKREIIGRYKGSFLGVVWSLFNPIFMLFVYTFVFSFLFKSSWNDVADSKKMYAIILFVGIIVFNMFSECVSKSPDLIVGNANLVKKIKFPLEILPLVNLLASLYHALVCFTVWLVASLIIFQKINTTALWLPLLLAPYALYLLALSWVISAAGVYVRDITQLVGVFISASMFLSPIFYPISMIPKNYESLMYLNPITFCVEGVRNALVFSKEPQLISLVIYWIIAIFVATLSLNYFKCKKDGFADVI